MNPPTLPATGILCIVMPGCRLTFSSDFMITSAARRSVGIDAALNLGDAFVVADDHGHDGDRASHKDCADRN
jgi:hypothetical protein